MNTQATSSEIASQALEDLTEALKADKSETLTAYLKVMARFTKYSWTNCLLIALQRVLSANMRRIGLIGGMKALGRRSLVLLGVKPCLQFCGLSGIAFEAAR